MALGKPAPSMPPNQGFQRQEGWGGRVAYMHSACPRSQDSQKGGESASIRVAGAAPESQRLQSVSLYGGGDRGAGWTGLAGPLGVHGESGWVGEQGLLGVGQA